MMGGQIDQVLLLHLRFYQLIGLHTLPLSGDGAAETPHNGGMLRLWAGCLLFGYTVLALFCMFHADEFLYDGDHFARFNDGLKFAFAEMAVVSIYTESIWTRYPLSRFWQTYAALVPYGAETMRHQIHQHWRFLLKIYATIVFNSVTLSILLCSEVVRYQVIRFWVTFQPFVFIIHLRSTQFVLHVELLRQQLRQLHNELALLVEYSEFANRAASFAGYEEFMRRRVRQKQLMYGHIHQLSVYFIQAFTYSMLAVFLMIYMRIAIDCYFLYYSYHTKVSFNDYYLLWPALLELPAFVYLSQSCMQMVCHIAHQLHNIVVRTPALSRQIQNFSLQLLHQPVHLHCLGIVVFDSSLLTRTATGICTYMLFTVQLMPKLSGTQRSLESNSI